MMDREQPVELVMAGSYPWIHTKLFDLIKLISFPQNITWDLGFFVTRSQNRRERFGLFDQKAFDPQRHPELKDAWSGFESPHSENTIS
jgi:hypothetical protein